MGEAASGLSIQHVLKTRVGNVWPKVCLKPGGAQMKTFPSSVKGWVCATCSACRSGQ